MVRRCSWVPFCSVMLILGTTPVWGQRPGKANPPGVTQPGNKSAGAKGSDLVFKELRRLDRKGTLPIGDMLIYSHDGKLALSSEGNRIFLADTQTWKVLQRFEGHDGHIVTALAFASDGKRFLSAGYDGRVWVWDIKSGKAAVKFEGYRRGETFKIQGKVHYTSPVLLLFSPGDKHVFATNISPQAWVWDPNTGKSLHHLKSKSYSFFRAVYSRDGRWILTSTIESTDGYHIVVWDAQTGKEVRRLEGTIKGNNFLIDKLAVTASGNHLVACCRDDTLRTWDIETGKQSKHLPLTNMPKLGGAALSLDGRRVVTWEQKMVKKWIAQRIYLGGGRFKVVANQQLVPDGDPKVHLWDVESGKRLGSKTHKGRILNAAFSPDGRHVLIGTEKQVQLWEIVKARNSTAGK